jgi:hypothetical protein
MPSGEGGEARCTTVQDEVRALYHTHCFSIVSLTTPAEDPLTCHCALSVQ